MAKRFASGEILAALKRVAQVKPNTLAEAVRPYVLLVALSEDIGSLREATTITLNYDDDWFDIALRTLIETYRPTTRALVSVPATVQDYASTATNAATERVVTRLG